MASRLPSTRSGVICGWPSALRRSLTSRQNRLRMAGSTIRSWSGSSTLPAFTSATTRTIRSCRLSVSSVLPAAVTRSAASPRSGPSSIRLLATDGMRGRSVSSWARKSARRLRTILYTWWDASKARASSSPASTRALTSAGGRPSIRSASSSMKRSVLAERSGLSCPRVNTSSNWSNTSTGVTG